MMISVKEMAKRVGCSSSTVINYIKAGKIKGQRLGPVWAIAEEQAVELRNLVDMAKRERTQRGMRQLRAKGYIRPGGPGPLWVHLEKIEKRLEAIENALTKPSVN